MSALNNLVGGASNVRTLEQVCEEVLKDCAELTGVFAYVVKTSTPIDRKIRCFYKTLFDVSKPRNSYLAETIERVSEKLGKGFITEHHIDSFTVLCCILGDNVPDDFVQSDIQLTSFEEYGDNIYAFMFSGTEFRDFSKWDLFTSNCGFNMGDRRIITISDVEDYRQRAGITCELGEGEQDLIYENACSNAKYEVDDGVEVTAIVFITRTRIEQDVLNFIRNCALEEYIEDAEPISVRDVIVGKLGKDFTDDCSSNHISITVAALCNNVDADWLRQRIFVDSLEDNGSNVYTLYTRGWPINTKLFVNSCKYDIVKHTVYCFDD